MRACRRIPPSPLASAKPAGSRAGGLLPLWNPGAPGAGVASSQCGQTRRVLPDGSTRCVLLDWPDGNFPYNPVPLIPQYWHGTLLAEKRDSSGLLYRRNRYYDPTAGRFTQEDPIGLAGGLNVYGFAAGDPVTYSDPYGLKVIFGGDTAAARQVWNELRSRADEARRTGNFEQRVAGRTLLRLMQRAERSETTYVVSAVDLNALGGGFEQPDDDRPGHHLVVVDPDGYPGQRASPWIILAHELGGAVSGWGHALPALHAESRARLIAGCWPRYFHGSDVYQDCHRP
jgi:RHS repeat-associated protein